MSTVTAILIRDEKVIKQYEMQRKSAVNLVKRDQGMWHDVKKNVVILYPRDANGGYQVPEVVINRDASPRAPEILKYVEQCISEQEVLRFAGKKGKELPRIYGIHIPRFVRENERVVLSKYQCLKLILTNLLV